MSIVRTAYRLRGISRLAQNLSDEDRFKENILKTNTCWLWVGAISNTGYGTFTPRKGKTVLAHRYSYRLFKGEIPDKKQLDHTCKTRRCVNPEHLEPVTAQENIRRIKGD